MLKSILCLLLYAQVTSVDAFKKEMGPLQETVDAAVTSTGARMMTSQSKATLLEGYGIVVHLEVALEPPPNIFSKVKTSAELKSAVAQRRKGIEAKISELLKDRIGKTESVGATESIAIVLYLFNTTPNAVPDLPAQLILSIKKDAPTEVVVREL